MEIWLHGKNITIELVSRTLNATSCYDEVLAAGYG
jgi:hypothetical protein